MIWADTTRTSWPDRIGDHLFLGEVVDLVGQYFYPGEWSQTDMGRRPTNLKAIPEFRERPVTPPMSIVNPDFRRVPSPAEQIALQRQKHEEAVALVEAHNAKATKDNAAMQPAYERAEKVRAAILAAGRQGKLKTAFLSHAETRLLPLEASVWADMYAPGLLVDCRITDRPWMKDLDQIRSNFIFATETSIRAVDWATVGERRALAPLGKPIPQAETPSPLDHAPPASTDQKPSDDTAVVKPSAVRLTSKADVETWYRNRVSDATNTGERPSRIDDEIAGREIGISRDRVRELRRQFAPTEWKDGGAPPIERRRKS